MSNKIEDKKIKYFLVPCGFFINKVGTVRYGNTRGSDLHAIPGTTSEMSVQMSPIVGTAKMLQGLC